MRWEYIYIVVNALLVTASTLIMRYGGKNLDFSQGLGHLLIHGRVWAFGIFIGWLSGLMFSLFLTRVPVMTASSLYIPLVYTLSFWGGVVFLKEPVDSYKIIGNIVIILGLCIFFRSGKLF